MSARRSTVLPGPFLNMAATPWPPIEGWISKALRVSRCLTIAAAVASSLRESSLVWLRVVMLGLETDGLRVGVEPFVCETVSFVKTV